MLTEVIIYAALAIVVCVMMYSILGKDVGKGEDDALNLDKLFKTKESAQPSGSNVVPLEPNINIIFKPIQEMDPQFTQGHFMVGAKAAYSMILEAFASGDRDLLKSLLTDSVYSVYEAAIDEREKNNYRQVTDLGRLKGAKAINAEINGTIARIQVLYTADLTSALLNESGDVVEGDVDVLSSISEIWEYERNLKSDDPAWRLADVMPSEGDTMEADPTPDTKTPET